MTDDFGGANNDFTNFVNRRFTVIDSNTNEIKMSLHKNTANYGRVLALLV